MTDVSSLPVARTALELADEAIDFAAELGVAVDRLDGGTTVIDCGIETTGSLDAGVLLAAIRRGGLVATDLDVGAIDDHVWPAVATTADQPVAATRLAATERIANRRISGPAVAGAIDPFGVVVAIGEEPIDEAAATAIAEAVDVDTGELYVVTAAPGSVAWGIDAAVSTLSAATVPIDESIDDGSVVRAMVEAPTVPAMVDGATARERAVAFRRLAGRAHVAIDGDVSPKAVVETALSPRREDGPAVVTVVDGRGRVASTGSVDARRLADDLPP